MNNVARSRSVAFHSTGIAGRFGHHSQSDPRNRIGWASEARAGRRVPGKTWDQGSKTECQRWRRWSTRMSEATRLTSSSTNKTLTQMGDCDESVPGPRRTDLMSADEPRHFAQNSAAACGPCPSCRCNTARTCRIDIDHRSKLRTSASGHSTIPRRWPARDMSEQTGKILGSDC